MLVNKFVFVGVSCCSFLIASTNVIVLANRNASTIGASGSNPPAASSSKTTVRRLPAWLIAERGTIAYVDIAPWLDSDEPEAALTASAASLRRDFSGDASRPTDIVYEPVGVRVRIEGTLPGKIVRVRGIDATWIAYAPLARLIPEIPAGTALRTAGGFGGFADFYPTLRTPQSAAEQLATGTPLVALGTETAPYDPGTSDLVRVRVRIAAGARAGTIGWLPVEYTGLPRTSTSPGAAVAEHACRCRLASFDDSP